jgi:hypothetical protein
MENKGERGRRIKRTVGQRKYMAVGERRTLKKCPIIILT